MLAKTGRFSERQFAENERLPVADLVNRTVTFSYQQGEGFVFLDATTFDELDLTAQQVGERHWFLKDNEEYKALFLDGNLLDIELPDHVAMRVAETPAAQRSAQQSTYKEAKLEGGLEIKVPLFIAPADVVRVDTRSRKYVGKE